MKKFFLTAMALAFVLTMNAQSGTNSPYSQYGFGQLSEQSTGYNRGMNGLGIGFREGNQVNFLNPASYSAVDSLTFIFDAGVSAQLTNFDENGTRKNAKNANFEYAVAAFRLAKHFGMSFGVMPYSLVGYKFYNTNEVGDVNATSYTNTYTGSGGLHQGYVGMGWEPFKGFSIGVNGAYLWGRYNRSIVNSYSDAYVNTLSKYYSADVANYTLDAGMQLSFNLSKKSTLTIGATYGYGHKLSADPECKVISTNSQTAVSDTTTYVVADGLEIPTTYGAGFMFNYDKRIKVGADFMLQKWGEVAFPDYGVKDNKPVYDLNNHYFQDLKKVTVGGDFCRNPYGRKFLSRMHYKVGASYTTPYLFINGKEGPKQIGVSAGVSFPIINNWNNNRANQSFLNISGQWVNTRGQGLLTENTFRINIGLTFNERWFMKWKVE